MVNRSDKFLRVAETIGIKLCKDAIWYEDKCNWVGMVENPDENIKQFLEHNSVQVSYEALGPTLYDGTSGIAYFLLQLYKFTNNKLFRKTAEGAIKQALYKIMLDKTLDFGFYTGSVGVAFVAYEIGKSLDDKLLLRESRDLIKKLAKRTAITRHLDVIAGNAGAIPPLLIMYNFFNEPEILVLAKHLGNEILSKATREKRGISWGPECNFAYNTIHNLTGFAHGAAGMGHSLVELFKKTGECKFLEGARNAFLYEDSWFLPKYNNWPDFRADEYQGTQQNGELKCSMGWCHGSPGIAFTRLNAYKLVKYNECKLYAKDALYGIKKEIQSNIDNYSDYSLCHGIGGIADLFMYASQMLKSKKHRLFAEFLGIKGIKNYINSGSMWPCGVTGGEIPGLMVGLSGIGYFYLRLYEQKNVPSILFITSD